MAQLHKEFTDSRVKELLERYVKKKIKIHTTSFDASPTF